MKEYKKKTEKILVEMSKQEELKNKKSMTNRWVIAIVSLLFYFSIVLLAGLVLKKGLLSETIILVFTVLLILALFYTFKMEIDTGYYDCKNCHTKFIPTYFEAMTHPIFGTTRYLKCPKCNKRNWNKKIMTKE